MRSEREVRRLTTILAADVAGYSRLMGTDELGTLNALKAHRKALIDPQVTEHDGRIVKLMGDGVLVEFPSVVEAVRCAVGIQEGMAERNADVPVDLRIQFRIGINIGDVIVEGDDIFGDGVNVASRLEALAEPGGVCLSRTVFNQVKTKVDFSFEDLGEQELKNIAEPIQVFRIGADDGKSRQATPVPAKEDLQLPRKPSIAILPFKNLSGDPNQDYLADGIRLAITAMLVKLSGLFLIAPNSVNTYRGKDVSAEQVGREMGVRCVLDGAVQRTGDRLRITVQLTNTVAQEVIWAEQYDRDLTDILATQDEITAEVVTALDVKLVSGEDTRTIRSTLKNLEALDSFYRGLSHFYIRTKDDNIAARKLFEKVSRLQPDSPVGPTYLCFTHWLDAFMGWTGTKNQSLMQAVSWADKALKFEGTNGLAHIVMAYAHLLNHRHAEALDACNQAVKLRPNCPAANSYLATVMHYCGQSAEAVRQIKQAMRITPVYPPWFLTLLAAAYRECGEVGKSISTAEHCLLLNPANVDARVILCADYGLSESSQKAQETARSILQIEPTFSVAKYLESQPYQNEEILNGLTESLMQAGLPG